MTKQEKLKILVQGIESVEICRCYFTYDNNYFYYYINAVNDKFILGQEEDDFLLDGYAIRKMSHLKKVEHKDDACNRINKVIGLTNEIKMPDIDITSWQTIFLSLKKIDTFIIIENAIEEEFYIGTIESVLKNKLRFRYFGADGTWNTNAIEIPYSKITNVLWNTRYSNTWHRYLKTDHSLLLKY